ncbi:MULTISPECIES: hypothetical protein [Sphingobacterium]|uniref:hypothetical protein n=1 Tax=Sphingobacterium TaxID=28453 RepID=UPI000969EACD|nr:MULTISPECIES: hypothetical protein [Sphingobacterium]OJZ08379.1 MAG: hypothetical protein BGP15_18380 [Sphingobacterium sp. 40-24]
MDTIIIKHIIDEEIIKISFDTQDGSLSFPSLELDIKTDIDFNDLLLKLSEFIEIKKSIEFEFNDGKDLLKASSKLNLVKMTLEEIYTSYNNQIHQELENTRSIELS